VSLSLGQHLMLRHAPVARAVEGAIGVGDPAQASDDPRVRTFRWHDPHALSARARSMSGLEILRAMVSGEISPPPFAELIGLRLTVAEPARAVFEFDPAEYMYSPLSTVHGGILTTVLDSAMGCALHTTLPTGVSYTTLELKVNFNRPVTERNGRMTAEGRVVHAGRTVATAEARLVDHAGKLHAHATSTLMVLRPRPD
jgi:uncharacterized protein (TIGR00369 family)